MLYLYVIRKGVMEMQSLVAGQKINIQELCPSNKLRIHAEIACQEEVDVSCFGVDAQNQLSDERYFIFYNQLASPEQAIVKQENQHDFMLDLNQLPKTIERLVFTAALDGNGAMGMLGASRLLIEGDGQAIAVYAFDGSQFQQQKAIIMIELYRRSGQWRLAVVGNGFDGGLSALLAHFGGQEAEPSDTPAPKVSLTKSERVQKVVLEKSPRLIDLTKKAIVSLEKKNLTGVTAQVLLVLDASGSMNRQYSGGRVQRLLDKVLPLALMFDDDGVLESWAFASRYRQLENVTIDNIDGYIERANGGWRRWDIGGVNNEPDVMEAVYQKHKNSSLPVYVIFISDGGVSKNKQIKDIIKTAAHVPIFWQFVGIGGKNYGVLEKLDEMAGRYVDNANFFALDDIDSVSDEALYDRLMGEFPQWLAAAKAKRILS